SDQHGLRDTSRPMAANVASDFSTTGRVADMNRLPQAERLDQLRKVVRVCVHVVPVPGLTRAAVTAAVVGNTSISPRSQKYHLVFPRVRTQRPSVTEHHRLPFTPVLEINLRAVRGFDCVH